MKRIWSLILFFGGMVPAVYGQTSYNSPETGEKVLGSYFATQIDTVSHTNGNLHVNIPLFTLPGRELPLRLAVDYNSQFYEFRQVALPGGGFTWFWDSTVWRRDSGIGGTLKAAKEQTGQVYDNGAGSKFAEFKVTITWVDSGGAKHKFVKTNVVFPCRYDSVGMNCYDPDSQITGYDNLTIDCTESDFLTITTGNYFSGMSPFTAPILSYKDGRTYNFNTRELRTLNGNRLIGDAATETTNCTSSVQLADYLPLSDTTGRTISFTGGNTQIITIPDDTGALTRTYKITYAAVPVYNSNQNLDTNFCMVSSVELPNAKTYQFEYETAAGNTKGTLKKITLPSGAYIQYAYTFPTGTGYPHVSSRSVNDSVSSQTWTYTYT